MTTDWDPEEVESTDLDLGAVYADGWMVAEQGGDYEHCPHKEGSEAYSVWGEGFEDGKRDLLK